MRESSSWRPSERTEFRFVGFELLAQKARWAKVRKNAGQKQNVVSMPNRRTMSAAGRKKIAAAQRARWAKIKGAQKKSA